MHWLLWQQGLRVSKFLKRSVCHCISLSRTSSMAGEDISFGFHLITYSGTSGRREMNQFIYFLCQKKERGWSSWPFWQIVGRIVKGLTIFKGRGRGKLYKCVQTAAIHGTHPKGLHGPMNLQFPNALEHYCCHDIKSLTISKPTWMIEAKKQGKHKV